MNRWLGPLVDLDWTRASGGLSTDTVYIGRQGGEGVAVLKRYRRMTPARLGKIHHYLGAARHLPFVAAPLPGADGMTWHHHGPMLADVVPFRPGEPVSRRRGLELVTPTLEALGELRRAWAGFKTVNRPVSVKTRLTVLDEIIAGPPPSTPRVPELDAFIAPAFARKARQLLTRWEAPPAHLGPCWCDPWRGNLLFSGDHLTGLIDHAAVKEDHPAVDLARAVGSMTLTPAQFDAALSGHAEFALARVLHATGLVVAAHGWSIALRDWDGPTPARVEEILAQLREWQAVFG